MSPTITVACVYRAFRRAAVGLLLTASLASAQIDISGEWGSRLHEDLGYRGTGPALGEYVGVPLNDAGRQKASSWDASILSSPEEQTKPHPAQYNMRGPGTNLRITKQFDPYNGGLVAYVISGTYGRADRTIWLDGRPHPSEWAEHTWTGFSTGRVERNKLVVTTTHMKTGWVLRNYAPSSNKAVMTEYFVRHGDMLTMTSVLEDPVYFDEPLVRSQTWVFSPNLGVDTRRFFEAVDEIPGRAADYVPHYPLGTQQDGFARDLALPFEATQGGSATLYPDYLPRLRQLIAGQTPPREAWTVPGLADAVWTRQPPRVALAADEVRTFEVRPGLFQVVVGGQNAVVHVGRDGVLVVDGGNPAGADALVREIRRLSEAPLRFILNTHVHPEATGSNLALVRAGGPRRPPGGYGPFPTTVATGAAVVAHDNVTVRLQGGPSSPGEEVLPTSTYSEARKDMYFNGEPIEVLHAPAAHTDGDSIVYFRKSDVVLAGGLLDTYRYPVIDTAAGGTLEGVIQGLTRIIEITIPERNAIGGTLVIPGRGRVYNEIDVVEYRNMLVIIRDRVRDLVGKGMTLEQVRAARVTLDYDGIYGASDGPWTTDMFLETVYREAAAGRAR
jgi:glyoxylase-like metal-dependent hydrolase (beta-lactamase superfamily II)